jgi:hypothetical protein
VTEKHERKRLSQQAVAAATGAVTRLVFACHQSISRRSNHGDPGKAEKRIGAEMRPFPFLRRYDPDQVQGSGSPPSQHRYDAPLGMRPCFTKGRRVSIDMGVRADRRNRTAARLPRPQAAAGFVQGTAFPWGSRASLPHRSAARSTRPRDRAPRTSLLPFW